MLMPLLMMMLMMMMMVMMTTQMFDEDKSGHIDEDEFFFLLQYLGIEVGTRTSRTRFCASILNCCLVQKTKTTTIFGSQNQNLGITVLVLLAV